MKKIILSLLAVIIILIGLVPFLDGYLFKKVYLQHLAYYQQELQAMGNQPSQQLHVESYDLGWFKSTVHLTFSQTIPAKPGRFQMPPIVLHIYSVIHHGPLVFPNNQFKIAYSFIETRIHAPDLMKAFIPENPNGFMQVQTLVSLSGDTWNNHYIFQPITLGVAQWDGLTGDINVTMQNGGPPLTLDSSMLFGKFHISSITPAMPEVSTEPMLGMGKMIQPSLNTWNLVSSLKLPQVNAKWQDGRDFTLSNLSINSESNVLEQIYNYDMTLTIASMKIPSPSPISSLTNLNTTLALKGFSFTEMQNLRMVEGHEDQILKVLTPNSNIKMTINGHTNLGDASANLLISLLALPKAPEEINNNLNLLLNLRIGQTLVNQVLPPNLLNQLVQQGVFVADKTDYVLAYTRKGIENTINGKVMTDSELSQLGNSLHESVSPNPVPAAGNTPPPIPQAVMPVAQKSGFHCFWMDANKQWILTPFETKGDCYRMDSCSGGLKQSNGGCYKWAATADGQAEPWHQ